MQPRHIGIGSGPLLPKSGAVGWPHLRLDRFEAGSDGSGLDQLAAAYFQSDGLPGEVTPSKLRARDPDVLNWAGRCSGLLLVLGVLALLLRRIYRRQKSLRSVRAARLEPNELKGQVDAGEDVYIIDLRHPLDILADPFTLPGAHTISPEALAARNKEIPRDRDIVLYCTCPSEATSAKAAMRLHQLGIERVRPLRGGFDEWKRLG